MKSRTIVIGVIGMLALLHSIGASAQTPPLNLPSQGGYKPVPNFTGTNAGEEFRGAINDRFSGIEPISPRLVRLLFAALPAEQDGLSLYCSDCQKTSPCSGGGSGAFAFGQNGQWSCTGPGNALINGQNAGGDLLGTFPNPSVTTVLGGKTPLSQGMTGASLNGVTGTKSDGSDNLSGFNGAHDKEINLMAYGASGAGLLVTTASGTAGSNSITVANPAGWKPTQGIIVNHGGAAVTLSIPSVPTVTVEGTPGASTCSYAIRALTARRGYTAASPTGTVTNCTASRTTNNFNHIQWAPVTSAWGYAVERVTPNPALIDVTTDTSTDDFGQVGAYARLQQFHELPSTADSSPGADWLQTTISGINGNTFTLATPLGSALNSLSYLSHDDTIPITNAYNASVNAGSMLYVPAGDYFFCGPPLNGITIAVRGNAPFSRIFTCDGQFDWVLPNQMQGPSKIDGMIFAGGLGVIDATTSSANTAQFFNFEVDNSLFYDFTQAAIAVENSDWPFWKIDHSFFQGLDFNNTIGVVMPGSDGIQLVNSQFSLCRIGMKLTGDGDGIVVANNTFLQPVPVYTNAQKPRVGIWLSGNNGSGAGGKDFVSENNKYGNEGLEAIDIRNLADGEGAGSETSTRLPDLVELDDAAIASGAATLTSAAECPFTSAMCQGGTGCTGSGGNWGIVVQNAGRGLGANSDALTTTIIGFTNTCSVTVAGNASTTVSGQIARTMPPNSAQLLGSHFIKNEVNGAGAFGSAPFVVSNENTANVEVSLNQFFNPPQEVWEQVVVPSEPFATNNIAAGNTMAGGNNYSISPGQQFLSNVGGLFNKLDPNQAFNHGEGELSIPYTPTGDVGATNLLTSLASSFNPDTGATLIGSVTDSFGKTTGDAAEFSFNGTAGSDIYANLGTVPANIPVWIYFETNAGSTSPLNRLNVEVFDQAAGNHVMFANPMTLTNGWHPWLLKFVPSVTTDEVLRFDGRWFGAVYDTGRFQVGRVRVYQGWTPPPMADQNINGDLAVKQANGSVALTIARGTDTSPSGDLQDFRSNAGATVAGTDVWGNDFTRIATVTYGASMTPDLSQGAIQTISATDASPFTINNPINETTGIRWVLRLANASGGTLGTVTFGADFKVGTVAAPANGKSRMFNCIWDGTNNWCAENGSDL